MAHLIDKDALVAKIESLKSAAETMLTGKMDLSYWRAQKCLCERFLSFINDLEVKEVDLDREMQAFALLYLEPLKISDSNIGISITMAQLYSCAKHFFELGIKARKA